MDHPDRTQLSPYEYFNMILRKPWTIIGNIDPSFLNVFRSACSEPNLTGKVVYDLDDPNRPRFTLIELKDILQERNSLKVRWK